MEHRESQPESGRSGLERHFERGVLVVGSEQVLVFADARACELLGCESLDECRALWPELAKWALAPAGAGSEAAAPEGTAGAASDAWRRLSFEPQTSTNGSPVTLVLVEARERGELLHGELLRASQTRSLQRFLRAMMHDIKAPLNTMVLNLELLRDRLARGDAAATDETKRHLRSVDVLKQEVARLTRELQCLQSQLVSAGDARQRFDLREMLVDLAGLIGPQARQQRIELETKLPEGPVFVNGIRDQLRLALLNVASGFFEVLPAGGRIRLGLETDEGQARATVSETEGRVTVAQLRQLLEMESGSKSAPVGAGLLIASAVVAAHGGSFQIGSGPEGGACIHVNLSTSS